MKIAELFARLGVNADTEKVKGFDRSLGSLKVSTIAVTAAVVKTARAVQNLTEEAFEAAAAFQQFEAETGTSAQSLQRWQAVAQATNNSATAVSESIKAISENQAAIRLGEGNISGFQLLGIDPAQDPFEILEELREKTDGLSQNMKRNVLSQMGVSSDLIQVLELTNEEFDTMAGRAFVLSPATIKSLDAAESSTRQVGMALTWLKQQIAAALAPSIADLNEKIVEWVQNNRDGIVRTLQTAFDWLQQFVSMVRRGVSMLDEIVQKTIGWEAAVKGIIAVIAVLNAHLLFSPLGAFIAGIVLLLAVLEDLYVYNRGGKSLFGYMMENMPNFAAVMNPIIDLFNGVKEAMQMIFSGDREGLEAMLDEWGNLGDILQWVLDLLEDIRDFFASEEFKSTMSAAGDIVGGAARGEFTGITYDPATGEVLDAAGETSMAGGVAKLTQNLFDLLGMERVGDWWSRRAFGVEGGATTNNIEVNVNGVTDPRAAGEAAAAELQRALNNSSAQRQRDE